MDPTFIVASSLAGGAYVWHRLRYWWKNHVAFGTCAVRINGYTISYNFGDTKKSVHIEWVYK